MRISSYSKLLDAYLVVRCTDSIADTLNVLDTNGQNFVVVVDTTQKLFGIVTDGDIRRAFRDNIRLSRSISDICIRKPITLLETQRDAEARHQCQIHSIKSIPFVDEKGCLKAVFINSSETIEDPSRTALFIMAGGKGKRLDPLTRKCPKPLINVAGRPIIDYILDKALLEGFKKIFISVNYLGNKIEKHVTEMHGQASSITFVHEDKPLGTAGSLTLVDFTGIENLVVINADIITGLALNKLLISHIKQKNMATMAVKEHAIHNPYGVVHVKDEQIMSFEEKPIYKSLINMGVYVLSMQAIDSLEKSKYCDMPTLFELLINNGNKVGIFRFHEFWMDLGSSIDLKRAQMSLDGNA